MFSGFSPQTCHSWSWQTKAQPLCDNLKIFFVISAHFWSVFGWLLSAAKKNRIKLSDVRTMGKTKQKYDTKYQWLAIQDQCSYALVQNNRKSIGTGFSWTAFFTSNLRTIDPICTRFILSGHGSWSISVCRPHFYISKEKKDDILVMWGTRNCERYSFPAMYRIIQKQITTQFHFYEEERDCIWLCYATSYDKAGLSKCHVTSQHAMSPFHRKYPTANLQVPWHR